MGKAPAFQFYAAEYLADENVQLLTLEQEGIYIRLLAYCWREGSIPAEPTKLSRLCKGCTREALSVVIELFESGGPDGRLVHSRLEDERRKHEAYRKKQAENGARGGRPAKANPEETHRKGLGFFGETQTEAKKRSSSAFASSTSSKSKKQKPSRDKREVDPRHVTFREFARGYWTYKNPALEMPWDGSEAKQLASLLAANPALEGDAFKELLKQRAKSQVNHAERPRVWLPKITDYAGGPLNAFNKPMEGDGNVRFKGKTESTKGAVGRVQVAKGRLQHEGWCPRHLEGDTQRDQPRHISG